MIQAYQAAYADPLIANAGEVLTPARREAEWPGWVWCRNAQGAGGWTPEAWLRIECASAVLLRDYTSAELSVQPGDSLTLLAEESGWYWALDAAGQHGWVPQGCLEPLQV